MLREGDNWRLQGSPAALLNRQFTVHRVDEPSVRRELAGSAEIREVLEWEFLLVLPDHTELGRRLDSLS